MEYFVREQISKAQQLQKKNATALKFQTISIMKPSEFSDQKI